MHHRVVSRKEKYYPFKPYWSCVCGQRLFAAYMGPGRHGLFAEFARHVEKNGRKDGNSDSQLHGV